MTVYGTPGGTPLNTTPFQGTQPGNPAQVTLQQINPGVGLFPPNSNNFSGDSVMAAASRAAVPVNAQVTGAGLTSQSAQGTGSGGRTVLDTLSDGGRNGTGGQPGTSFDTLNSDMNGGQSFGAGGANQTEGPTSGQGSQLSTQTPAAAATYNGGATPVYGG